MATIARACIPMPLQIVLDDVGWWSGADGSERGEPFRTGIDRDHVPDDYRAIVQLGRELGVRPQAAMILCEWDRENLLASLPASTWMGEAWDNSHWVGPWLDEAAAIFRENPSHIELTLHGIGHEYWEDGSFTRAEWYDQERCMRPRDEVIAHLDAYAALLEQNGLGPMPSSFVPAAFLYCYGDGQLSPILRDRGVTFASSPFATMGWHSRPDHALMGIDNGVAWVDRGNVGIPWDAMAAEPPDHIDGPILGLHWPNILHADPDRNAEVVAGWADALRHMDQRFDRVLARTSAHCQTQLAFQLGAEVEVRGDEVHFRFGGLSSDAADTGHRAITVKIETSDATTAESRDMTVQGVERLGDHLIVDVDPSPGSPSGSLRLS